MDTYEYRHVELLGVMETPFEVQLNDLGAQGWLLVSLDHGKRSGVFVRKIRREEPSDV
jgi:hypothetical protein